MKTHGFTLTFCTLLFVSVAWFATPATALCDSEGSVQQKKTITDAKGKKVTVIDFNDSVIEGKAKAPDGFVLQSRQGGQFRSILSLRKNFRPQIASSATEGQVRMPSSD